MRLVRLGLVVLALGVVVAYALRMTSGDGESRRLPGPPWSGQGTEGISQTEAEQFDRFGLYWLGPAFAGFNLQAILMTGDEVTFIYGTCTIPRGRDGGCAVPLSVRIEHVCKITPELATQFAYTGPVEVFRGEALVVSRYVPELGEASARIWTGDSAITISFPGAPELLNEALLNLHGIRDDQPKADRPLPIPHLSACSEAG
jgi:hypothetical protein